MALIKCNNCGKPVSDQLMACPHCGAPVTGMNIPPQQPGQAPMPQQGYSPYGNPRPMAQPKKGTSPALIALIACLVVAVLALGGFVVYKYVMEPRTTTESPWEVPDDDEVSVAPSLEDDNSRSSASNAAVQEDETVVDDSGFEWLSHRYATMSDIAGKTSAELRIMRNSIYASHGRYFKDPTLRDYFNAQSWYKPYRDEVPNEDLNGYEKKNVEFLKSHE